MSLDPSFIGRSYPPTPPYEVGREKIREFATAVGAAHPAHNDRAAAQALGHPDIVAPPTFPVVLSMRAGNQIIDRNVSEDVAGALRLPQVTADQAAVGAAHASNRLAGGEVHHLVDVHAAVRLSPPVDRKGEHRHVPRFGFALRRRRAGGRNNLIGNASRGL